MIRLQRSPSVLDMQKSNHWLFRCGLIQPFRQNVTNNRSPLEKSRWGDQAMLQALLHDILNPGHILGALALGVVAVAGVITKLQN